MIFYKYISDLERLNDEKARLYLEEMHPADIMDVLENVDENVAYKLFALLPVELSSLVLEEATSTMFTELLDSLPKEKRKEILAAMSTDEIAYKMTELDEEEQSDILSHLDEEEREEVSELLEYEEGTAGQLMSPDFTAINAEWTAFRAIEELRNSAPSANTIYYLYVVDEVGRLIGVVSLRELIVAQPTRIISSLMNDNVIRVMVYDKDEEVAKVVQKYDLLAIPVVDENGILEGIVTIDDVMDVIEEHATEDILKMAGTSEDEVFEKDAGIIERVMVSTRSRLPWLIITIFGGMLSSLVISQYQDTISMHASLALFMPLLTGMGGNVGTQSSTITVRNLATQGIEGKDIFRTLIHEVSTGLAVGVVCAIIVALYAFLTGSSLTLSLIVAVAMTANILTAAAIGTIVPLIFKRVGVDPAVASAPFITTTIDITGLTIYFSLATLMLINLT